MTFGGSRTDQHNVPHAIVISIDMGGGKSNCVIGENISPTLTTTHYGEPVVAYETDKGSK